MPEWKSSACILCACNCGIEVQLGGEGDREIVRTRGDKAHPGSRGYLCQKASGLIHYQTHAARVVWRIQFLERFRFLSIIGNGLVKLLIYESAQIGRLRLPDVQSC